MPKTSCASTIFLILLFNQMTLAQGSFDSSERLRLQRLQTVADIWSRIYLTHPAVFTNHLDFDQVLREAIPAVERAGSTEQFVSVLNEKLFYPLLDPLVFAQVVDPENDKPLSGPGSAKIKRIGENIMMLDATDQRVYWEPSIINKINNLLKVVRPRDTLVVDLRWKTAVQVDYHPGLWLRLFANSSLSTGYKVSRQMIQRSDLILNTESSIWAFSNNSFKVEPSVNLNPAREGKNEPGWFEELEPVNFDSLVTINNPLYFIVNNTSYPAIAHTLDGLQGQHNIRILWDKTGNFLLHPQLQTDYPENIRVNLDCNMLVSRTGYAGVLPNVIYPVPPTEIQILNDLRKGIKKQNWGAETKLFSYNIGKTLLQKPGNPVSREERVIGLMKIWMVINFLSPHVENATMDWKNVLHDWIPKVEKAEKREDYVLTIQMLLAGLNDSHFGVWDNNKPPHDVGNFLPSIRLKRVEGKVIVAEIAKDFSIKGLEIGDEVDAIDGRTIESINHFWRQRYSASSDQAFNRWLWNSPLAIATRGEKESAVKLKILSRGKAKEFTLNRTIRSPWVSKEDIMSKHLLGNMGYIRHYAIPNVEMRDSIIDAYANTDGLIIDLRGRTRISVFPLATYFSKKPIAREKFEEPLVSFIYGQLVKGIVQLPPYSLLPGPNRQYSKPVVVLIDANMQSHSESAAIILSNIANVTLVGSNTTGTTGSAIPVSISEGVSMNYTSQKISNTDGSPFQNIGVIPDVLVEPTIKGIKEGRDEVLEKGIEILNSKITSLKTK